ncbi:MAG: DUF11 domain-containing protein, partial [Chloroflexi bacterium]|nr:DUF11 domain-containing protein [Chloroflexota bacterium]
MSLQTATTGVTVNEVLTDPDLAVAKTGPAEVAAGALIIYDIIVANQGGESAANVIITDTLPISTTFVSSSLGGSVFDENTGTVVWTIDFLSGGESETFTLQAQVDSDMPASTPITNTVNATFAGTDLTPEDNEDSHTAVILPPPPGPDLFVHKTGPTSVPAGFPIEYEITVANQGGTLATGIIVTDTLPISTTFVSSSHEEWNTVYDAATGDVVFNIAPLAAGDSYNFTIQAQLSATAPIGDITNTAVGTINEAETNLTYNQSTYTTAVLEPAPQLTIEPANNDSNAAVLSVLQGTTASMIITATNTGTGPLLGGLSLTRGNEQLDINYPWLEITPLTTSDIAVGDYVAFTVNVTDNTLANGSYYDLIAIDSNDPSVASE